MNTLFCGHGPSEHGEHTTGTAHYRVNGNTDTREICWDCAALIDVGHMLKMGHSGQLPLYLTCNDSGWSVSNWPGSLRFPVMRIKKGKHNIGRTRADVWFVGPDGFMWHGVQVGEWTQICHCKRTVRQVAHKAA
jgi:hypothetical protein